MILKVRLELVRELFIVVGSIHVFFKARMEMLLAPLARILDHTFLYYITRSYRAINGCHGYYLMHRANPKQFWPKRTINEAFYFDD